MLVISRFFPKQLFALGRRSIFSESYFAIDLFKEHTVYVTKKFNKNLNDLKKTIKYSVEESQKIFLDDLRNFIYITKTDGDFDLLLKAVNK